MLTAVAVSERIHVVDPDPGVKTSPDFGSGMLWLLRLWDYGYYRVIAEDGYVAERYAFFPLWPLLLRLGGEIGSMAAVGTIVAIAATGAAFVGVAQANPSGSRRRTALALAALPGAFSLLMAYPDALALAAAAWSCVAAARDRWLVAAFLAFGAAAARPNGFLVAIPLLSLAFSSRQRGRWVAAGVPVATFASVNVYFWVRSGSPFAFVEAQGVWGRGGPWRLPETAVQYSWHGLLALFALGLLAVLWRFGTPYRAWFIYAAAVLLVSLASGTVLGIGRHMLFAFPLVWAAADGPRFLRGPVAVVTGLALNVVQILLLVARHP
jgi:hypothetical protein